MIVVMRPEATEEDAQKILGEIEELGLKPLYMPGSERTVLGAIGDERAIASLGLEGHPLIESVKPILAPYKLVSRELHPHDTIVEVGGLPIGGAGFTVIAGPCSVEGLEAFGQTARAVRERGAHALRGGAFKPRTSPYSFQGLGDEGLEIMRAVSRELGMPTFTEVLEVADIEAVAEHADAFQVGSRNMQNFRLLEALGEQDKPVLLKRGMAAKVEELSAGRRVHRLGGQRPGDPVRARHQLVRDGHAQHPGSERDPVHQAAQPPARARRSLARDGRARVRHADGPGRGGRRRRRDHRRGPPRADPRALRRSPVAVPGAVR